MAESMAEETETCSPLPLGGYDHQFVEPPLKQWECPICLLTLRAPHLLSCCGVKICQSCIEGVKNKGKACPKCRQADFFTLLDKELERLIFDLIVHCPLSVSGCGWTGELRYLDKHVSPSQEGECPYVEVECSHGCGQKMMRRDMGSHEKETCSKLPVEIQMQVLQDRVEKVFTKLTEQHETEITTLKAKVEEQEQEIASLKVAFQNTVAKSEAHCMTYAHLKKSALELMPKLKGGAIPGVHYHASNGNVEIYGCTEVEVQARAYRFQLEYQKVILSVRIKHIDLLPFTNEDELSVFLTELNQKYEATYLFQTSYEGTNVVKVISIVISQFDEAVRAVEGKLKQLQVSKLVLASGRKVTLKMGDITKEDVDVIVSAANRALQQNGGAVSRALNKASNGELQKLADKYTSDYGNLQLGDVAVTHSGGGTLKCKYVIHLVGPKSSHVFSSSGNSADILYDGITKALVEGLKLRASSIALPAIGSGSFLIKNDVVAPAILNAVTQFDYRDSKALKDIRVVIFNPSVYGEFAEQFQKII